MVCKKCGRETKIAVLCKKCHQQQWRENNREKDREIDRKWREKNKDKINKKSNEWYHKNKKRLQKKWKEYYKDNKEKVLSQNKKWRENNREKERKIQNIYTLNREHSDTNFRLRKRFASQIVSAIKKQQGKKAYNTIKLLGCSIKKCIEHLNKTAPKGITINDIGQYKYHIDHIIPCASFDLTKEEEQLKCFHYTNLQLLWWEENIKKGVN